jgi:hypothetical protein
MKFPKNIMSWEGTEKSYVLIFYPCWEPQSRSLVIQLVV